MIFTFRESPPICPDKLNVVGDHLNGASFNAFVGFPLLIIENAGDSDLGALVQMLFNDLREAVETGDLDPSGLLF